MLPQKNRAAQTVHMVVVCKSPELKCKSERRIQVCSYTPCKRSSQKSLDAYFWTRDRFIFTLDQQEDIFSTGFSVPNEACAFPKVKNNFILGGVETSGFLPEEALNQQGVCKTANSKHVENIHWFKVMIKYIIYPRLELLKWTFGLNQTH